MHFVTLLVFNNKTTQINIIIIILAIAQLKRYVIA